MAAAAAVPGAEGGCGGGGSVVRIFVGGLAEGVREADLESVFGSIGRVAGVEFVRTNGRSFAYVDFHCPSDKALAKLFSTYNGCKWKGGKLRLEKAKEHYLTRLKREWEQEAAAATAAVQEPAVKDSVEKQEKPKHDKAALEGMKINIYFPKLRKVKPLPFKGSGKHKYSFRNIAVPSYPIHFCDCEEHCGPPETANDEYASALNAVSYEKERNIMNFVMSKLFEKENQHFDSSETEKHDAHISTREPTDAVNGLEMEQTEEATNEDLDEMQMEETEEPSDGDLDDESSYDESSEQTEEAPNEDLDEVRMEETEEPSDEDLDDDLVINIAPRKSNKSIVQIKTKDLEVNKDSQSRKRPRFEEASLPKKRQGFEASSESGKRKKEPTSVISGKGAYEFSSAIPRDQSPADPQGVEALASSTKSESERNMISMEPKKGSVWTQKASWRELVGGAVSTPFSISQVLPNTNPSPTVVSNVNESEKSAKFFEATTEPLSEQMLPSSMGIPTAGAADGSTGHGTVESKENNKTQKVRVVPKITIGEVCPFMRNAESEKQWSKARKVLSGFNKKNKEGSGSNSNAAKGKPLRRR